MKPLILITNDDGVFAPGIKAAAEAVADLGELVIVAPRFEQSGAGHSYPKLESNGIIEEVIFDINGKKQKAYGVYGSPAQSVLHAMQEICDRLPDLCVSGINNGENIGRNLTASGTIGAALAASDYGIPSIAVSLEKYASNNQDINPEDNNWEPSKYFLKTFAKDVLEKGMENGASIYNINVPNSATNETPIKHTIQSKNRHLTVKKHPKREDFTKPHRFHLKVCDNISNVETNSDVHAIRVEKVVSITYLGWDLSINKQSN